jgi:hypothetical protein
MNLLSGATTLKGLQLKNYRHIWGLLAFEITQVKHKWAECQCVVVKNTRNSKLLALVISKVHRSQVPSKDVFQFFLHGAGAYSLISAVLRERDYQVHTGDDSENDDSELDQDSKRQAIMIPSSEVWRTTCQ